MRGVCQAQSYPAARLWTWGFGKTPSPANRRFDWSPVDALIGLEIGYRLCRQIPVRHDLDAPSKKGCVGFQLIGGLQVDRRLGPRCDTLPHVVEMPILWLGPTGCQGRSISRRTQQNHRCLKRFPNRHCLQAQAMLPWQLSGDRALSAQLVLTVWHVWPAPLEHCGEHFRPV